MRHVDFEMWMAITNLVEVDIHAFQLEVGRAIVTEFSVRTTTSEATPTSLTRQIHPDHARQKWFAYQESARYTTLLLLRWRSWSVRDLPESSTNLVTLEGESSFSIFSAYVDTIRIMFFTVATYALAGLKVNLLNDGGLERFARYKQVAGKRSGVGKQRPRRVQESTTLLTISRILESG